MAPVGPDTVAGAPASDAAVDLAVDGVVQGVGFRPFVHNLAVRLGLSGRVLNATDGVRIHLEGPCEQLDLFERLLVEEAPPAAIVTGVTATPSDHEGCRGFSIDRSRADSRVDTLVSPDLATCDACARELFDPADRRFHYPFVNCTNCGPRFTVIESLPYDRPATTMARFEMCPRCTAEYSDPSNRRFHAQPDACFVCGPQLLLFETPHGAQLPGALPDDLLSPIAPNPGAKGEKAADHERRARERSDAIVARAARLLCSGRIVAVKGLGGFHLACDATDEGAVAALRERKHRPAKPLAVMFAGCDDIRACCELSADEAELLQSPARPIVLLRMREGCELAPGIAPGLGEVGCMLPSTPLQHLLLDAVGGRPLVMTSGNRSGEPIVTDDVEAREVLGAIVDAVLGNDRPIRSRYDDSVMRVVNGRILTVRRARGLAPLPIGLPKALEDLPPLLATGPQQKATLALTKSGRAFVSQHIGDLEGALTFESWERTAALYQRLFDIDPAAAAHDAHPGYRSTLWALEHAEATGLPLRAVQHHHAHIAAVTAENGFAGRVIGVALDGTGAGDDGTVWGGELLLCDWTGFERVGHLRCLPLAGGEAAVLHPQRMAAAALHALGLDDHPAVRALAERMEQGERDLVATLVDRRLNCPDTSSAGRLLDAVAAVAGICEQATYDGQPAIELEAAAWRCERAGGVSGSYSAPWRDGLIDTAPLLCGVLDDLAAGMGAEAVALKAHRALAAGVVEATAAVAREHGIGTVALGGGVFMNTWLLTHIAGGLRAEGLSVLEPIDLPPNDGAISYGQAVVALATYACAHGGATEEEPCA